MSVCVINKAAVPVSGGDYSVHVYSVHPQPHITSPTLEHLSPLKLNRGDIWTVSQHARLHTLYFTLYIVCWSGRHCSRRFFFSTWQLNWKNTKVMVLGGTSMDRIHFVARISISWNNTRLTFIRALRELLTNLSARNWSFRNSALQKFASLLKNLN